MNTFKKTLLILAALAAPILLLSPSATSKEFSDERVLTYAKDKVNSYFPEYFQLSYADASDDKGDSWGIKIDYSTETEFTIKDTRVTTNGHLAVRDFLSKQKEPTPFRKKITSMTIHCCKGPTKSAGLMSKQSLGLSSQTNLGGSNNVCSIMMVGPSMIAVKHWVLG